MRSEEIEKHYGNGDLTVVWRPGRCIHASRCWKGLPGVFDPRKRPWVTITGATSAEIAAQVRRCPSGALTLLGDPPPEQREVAVSNPRPRALDAPVRALARAADASTVTRDLLIHRLHESAELEHALMCTYLYAAFSLRQGVAEELSPEEEEATARWRRIIMDVAIEEMGHLAAVWNLTSALGGVPRFGRANFPIDAGLLPAAVVVKLAPFGEAVIQHFVHLERPLDSQEPEGAGFTPEVTFTRGTTADRLTPMSLDYDTIGALYTTIERELRAFVEAHGEDVAFAGDPALQLSQEEVALDGATQVTSLESALSSLASIVAQGEGSPRHADDSHFARFAAIRDELTALRSLNPCFEPAFPAATNPVLRRPPRAADRVHIENEDAARTVDIANASYALMLRLLAYAYALPRTTGEKRLAVSLAIELMRAVTMLGERAARLPAGPSHPACNAGVSFTTLRDTAPLAPGMAARIYFMERFEEIAAATATLDGSDPRAVAAARISAALAKRATQGFGDLV